MAIHHRDLASRSVRELRDEELLLLVPLDPAATALAAGAHTRAIADYLSGGASGRAAGDQLAGAFADAAARHVYREP